MQLYQVCKVIIVKRQFSLSNNETYYQYIMLYSTRGEWLLLTRMHYITRLQLMAQNHPH
jgi:hypothetical protein